MNSIVGAVAMAALLSGAGLASAQPLATVAPAAPLGPHLPTIITQTSSSESPQFSGDRSATLNADVALPSTATITSSPDTKKVP